MTFFAYCRYEEYNNTFGYYLFRQVHQIESDANKPVEDTKVHPDNEKCGKPARTNGVKIKYIGIE